MSKHTKAIVAAIINNDNDSAKSLFESTMRSAAQFYVADMKFAIGGKLFEEAEINAPETRDFKVDAIDTSQKPEHLPNGTPVRFTVPALSHEGAAKAASKQNPALKIQKIIDPEGNEKLFESLQLNEALRLKSTHVGSDGVHSAKVYHDNDWGEYRVKFFKGGKHLGDDADYHADDIDDANDTAKSQLSRYSSLKESVDLDSRFNQFKQAIEDKHGDVKGMRYVNHADNPDHISATKGDRTYGMFNRKTGDYEFLGEGTETGGIEAQIASDEEQEKQAAFDASKRKSPTIDDVTSVLGNTVSVSDQNVVQ